MLATTRQVAVSREIEREAGAGEGFISVRED
jgi:hypothetical protein